MYCKYCGKEILNDSKFCSFCGKQRSADITKGQNTVSEDVHCLYCGAKIRSEDRFCPSCGAEIKNNGFANVGNTILGSILQGIDLNSIAFRTKIKKYLFYGLEWIAFLVSALILFTGSLFDPSEEMNALISYNNNIGSISGMMKVTLFDFFKGLFAMGKYEGWDHMNAKYYICLISLAIICVALVVTAIAHAVFLGKRVAMPYGYVEILNSGYFYHISVFAVLGLLSLFRLFDEDLSRCLVFSSNCTLLILLSIASLAVVFPLYKKAAYLAKEYNE